MKKRATTESTIVDQDWLAISTEGFEQQNSARPPAHRAKELIQNSMDAFKGGKGEIRLTFTPGRTAGQETVLVTCTDNGPGMENLTDIRVMFLTTKTDSRFDRGRMGRGFKEMLCTAIRGSVDSAGQRLIFDRSGNTRVLRRAAGSCRRGMEVSFLMPWAHAEIGRLREYFALFILPPSFELIVDDSSVPHRQARHCVEAMLTTELFQNGQWVKPRAAAQIELVPCQSGEEPMLYEMGIPVCSAEWTVPYHANVLQRVPMNPNRDAVMSGYLVRVHKACLPLLLDEMNGEQVRSEWVGSAGVQADAETQKQIVHKAFGENAVRSVPSLGRRDSDNEAEEAGLTIVRTGHLPEGFRQMTREHLPTSAEAVAQRHQEAVYRAADSVIDVAADNLDARRKRLIASRGGPQRIQRIMDFARFFCEQITAGSMVTVRTAMLKAVDALATWNAADELTLGLDQDCLWVARPINAENITTLVHEAAHHNALHHGLNFQREVERLAGVAACVMLRHHDAIVRQWGDLLGLD